MEYAEISNGGQGIGMGMEWVVHSLKRAPGAIQALKLLKLIV